MATRWEFYIVHEDQGYAASAAHAAFDDVDRLENELSRFRPWACISRINAAEAGQAVAVHEAALDCLSYGKEIWAQTAGAFDVTIGPLFAALRGPDGMPRKVPREELDAARARCGYQHLEINAEEFTVTPKVPGMSIDLGAIGKGYALDQAAILLREDWGITDFLLNAGDSTLLGSGSAPGRDGWLVRAGGPEAFLLKNEAVSGTGFMVQGAHIVDPRTARLTDIRRLIRWSRAPNAALADALSTAFMVMNKKEIQTFCASYPEVACLGV